MPSAGWKVARHARAVSWPDVALGQPVPPASLTGKGKGASSSHRQQGLAGAAPALQHLLPCLSTTVQQVLQCGRRASQLQVPAG